MIESNGRRAHHRRLRGEITHNITYTTAAEHEMIYYHRHYIATVHN